MTGHWNELLVIYSSRYKLSLNLCMQEYEIHRTVHMSVSGLITSSLESKTLSSNKVLSHNKEVITGCLFLQQVSLLWALFAYVCNNGRCTAQRHISWWKFNVKRKKSYYKCVCNFLTALSKTSWQCSWPPISFYNEWCWVSWEWLYEFTEHMLLGFWKCSCCSPHPIEWP